MLTREQLLALLADLESDRIERTASTSKTDKFGEAICAFANDLSGHGQPGYLLIGVHDNGALSRLNVTDAPGDEHPDTVYGALRPKRVEKPQPDAARVAWRLG